MLKWGLEVTGCFKAIPWQCWISAVRAGCMPWAKALAQGMYSSTTMSTIWIAKQTSVGMITLKVAKLQANSSRTGGIMRSQCLNPTL